MQETLWVWIDMISTPLYLLTEASSNRNVCINEKLSETSWLVTWRLYLPKTIRNPLAACVCSVTLAEFPPGSSCLSWKHANKGVKCRIYLKQERGKIYGVKLETQEGVFPLGTPQTGCFHLTIKIPHGVLPMIVISSIFGVISFQTGFQSTSRKASAV